MDNKLIFDIGLHRGLDSKFYCDKGFNVVGLEARQDLCEYVRESMDDEVKREQLIIVERALWHASNEKISFFSVDEKDDWGSVFQGQAEKGLYQSREVVVESIILEELLDEYGEPYYIKCDIEGGDAIFVRQLLKSQFKPQFVSLEATAADDLACLAACGYDQFQLINQSQHAYITPPNPAREGEYVDAQFNGHMSGLFGLELDPSKWYSFETAMEYYLTWRRLKKADEHLAPGWVDFHAGFSGFLKEHT